MKQRHLPGRGFSAGIVLLGVGAVMIWGHRRTQGAVSERRYVISYYYLLHSVDNKGIVPRKSMGEVTSVTVTWSWEWSVIKLNSI